MTTTPTALVAVDWGTTSLRAAGLGIQDQVLEERSLPRGILTSPANGFAMFFKAYFIYWMWEKYVFRLISDMAGSQGLCNRQRITIAP